MASNALLMDGLLTSSPTQASDFVEPIRPRVALAGTLIDQLDRSAAVERIKSFVVEGGAHQVVTVNLDFLSIASFDPGFQQTINQADLAVPDGMPIVWLSRWKGQPVAERVAGVDLVDDCCEIAADMQRGVFLLGAAPGIAEKAALQLERRHPGLRVVGTYSPPIGPLDTEENARIVRMIREARPDFLFVALGAPRQDVWISQHLDQIDVPVAMGVGCVLDLLAGEVTRAPAWMQNSGLEWLYRLAHEPGRLWRRYLVNDLPIFARLLVASGKDLNVKQLAPSYEAQA